MDNIDDIKGIDDILSDLENEIAALDKLIEDIDAEEREEARLQQLEKDVEIAKSLILEGEVQAGFQYLKNRYDDFEVPELE